ncbi:hypothetical protein BGX24_002309 [Mortierella sp. AD032]|nr:hypothetical protein BGX24_002309 [Mortierella sp. AD032]
MSTLVLALRNHKLLIKVSPSPEVINRLQPRVTDFTTVQPEDSVDIVFLFGLDPHLRWVLVLCDPSLDSVRNM